MAEEKRFECTVKRFLKDHGCYYIKYWGGGTYTKSGVPDLLVSIGGYFHGIELKASHGRPTPLQVYHLQMVSRSGGTGILLYPQDMDDFKSYVRDITDYGYKPKQVLGRYPFLKRWWHYA